MAAAFGTWAEVWDTMKRMRNLMHRVAEDTLSARFLRWMEFTKMSVRERMESFNNLAEYAIVIQSWTCGRVLNTIISLDVKPTQLDVSSVW